MVPLHDYRNIGLCSNDIECSLEIGLEDFVLQAVLLVCQMMYALSNTIISVQNMEYNNRIHCK